jgi:hypothetical protein
VFQAQLEALVPVCVPFQGPEQRRCQPEICSSGGGGIGSAYHDRGRAKAGVARATLFPFSPSLDNCLRLFSASHYVIHQGGETTRCGASCVVDNRVSYSMTRSRVAESGRWGATSVEIACTPLTRQNASTVDALSNQQHDFNKKRLIYLLVMSSELLLEDPKLSG